MTPFEYLLGIPDKIPYNTATYSDHNVIKPIIPQLILRIVHGKKWNDLTFKERLTNRKGMVDGRPQELGLILDNTLFDILTIAPQLLKSAVKGGAKKAYSLVDDASKLSEKELLEKYPRLPNKGWFDIMKTRKKEYLELWLHNNNTVYDDITNSSLTTNAKNQLKNYYNSNSYKNKVKNILGNDSENYINSLNKNIDNTKVIKGNNLEKINGFEADGVTEFTGKLGNINLMRIRIKNDSENRMNDVLYHEFTHRSSEIGTTLPKEVIKHNESIKPKLNFDRSINSKWYDYLNIPDEIRARAISTDTYLKKNNISFDDLNINPSNYKTFPSDVFEYATNYDKPSAKKYLESFLTTIPIISSIDNALDNKPVQYKYGGIHINPANKGKFTATKKRTDKTTKELTHSKNPLTRKRAIFAQNASKWNHK